MLLVMAAVLWSSVRGPGVLKVAARSQSSVIVQIHFAGGDNISTDKNSTAFENEFSSPQARALESQTLDKLSRAPGVWFKDKLPTGASDGSALLRPLLDDFLKSEWVFEMRDAPASPEYALAIRLDVNRAQLWQNNLRSLLESWTKITAQDIPGGWELKKDVAPNLFRFVRAGNWVIIGCGQDELPTIDDWSRERTIPQIGTDWLSAKLDWPRLAQLFPALAAFDFPQINLHTAGKDGNLQLTGTLDLTQPLPSLEKWQVPAEIIHQPLTSFTAARGFAPWLNNQAWAKDFRLSPDPDQLFIWSLGLMPLQTFIAVPVPDATRALAQLGENLSADASWQSRFMFPMAINKTPGRISLQGAPFIAPEVLALRESSGNFLFGDVFPNIPRGKAPPPEVFQVLNQPNLVFYHWEITSARLKNLPQLTQLALMLTKHFQLNGSSAASQWLELIGPTAGVSVTEATETGPMELSFSRSSPTGLTAVELIALANWLETPNFPGCDLRLPTKRFTPHRPMKKLAAPMTTTPAPH